MPPCKPSEICSRPEGASKNETEKKEEKEKEEEERSGIANRRAHRAIMEGKKCVVITLKKGLRGLGFKIDRELSDRKGIFITCVKHFYYSQTDHAFN